MQPSSVSVGTRPQVGSWCRRSNALASWATLVAIAALAFGCASSVPRGVRLEEPRESGLGSYEGPRFAVPVSFRLMGTRTVSGTAAWNTAPVIADIDVGPLRAQDYLFPVGEMIERASREALEGPFAKVESGDDAPIQVQARLGDFQLLHRGAGSEASIRVDVRYRVLDERGREIQKIRHQADSIGPFDGEHVPEALWAAVYEVAERFRASLADSSSVVSDLSRRAEGGYAALLRDNPPLGSSPSSSRSSYGSGYGRRVAVVIGIDAYDSWPALEGATADARAVANVLRDSGFEVVELYDREATRTRILSLLGEDLPRRAEPESLAMVFFAGHGHTETLANGEKRGYVIPVDGDSGRVYSTAISMQEIRDLSNRLPAKHVYYAMDSCYSGLGFVRGIRVAPTIPDYYEKMTSRRVVQMITAGQEGEQAVERGGRGVFTTHLLQALAGDADYNGDGFVTASEIGAFVPPAVTRATGGQQTPRFGTLEGTGEVVFDLRR